MAVPLSVISRCGPLDGSFRYGEDTEFIVRLLSSGVSPVFLPFIGVHKHAHNEERLASDFCKYAENSVYERIIDKHMQYLEQEPGLLLKLTSIAIQLYHIHSFHSRGRNLRRRILGHVAKPESLYGRVYLAKYHFFLIKVELKFRLKDLMSGLTEKKRRAT